MYEPDEQVKEKKHADFSKNVYPWMLQKLDALIKKNNGHIALGRVI